MARIWVGRPEAEAEAWCEELRAAGHEAAALPLIAVRRLAPGPEDRAVLADLASFDWAFFTSRHAVAALFDLLPEGAWPERLRAAAVGAATAAALRGRGVEPALCGDGGGAELAAAYLARGEDRGVRLLVLGARGGRPEPAAALTAAGHPVARLELHEAVEQDGPCPPPGEPVLVFSPSAVRSLARRVASPAAHPVWAIGPTTAAAARGLGFPVAARLPRPVPRAVRDLLPS